MQRVGKGFVFVSAILWVVAGAVVFWSPQSGDLPRVAHVIDVPHAAQVATANAALSDYKNSADNAQEMMVSAVDTVITDGSNANTWEGPYYIVADQDPPATVQQEILVEKVKPWYVQVFGGFGSMVQSLLQIEDSQSYGSVFSASVKPAALPPACTISIIPNSVPYGGSATVTWTSRNADHVIFQGIGEVPRSGSFPVKQLTSTRALALAVVGAEGSSSCYTVVNVEPIIVEAPTCVISGHPSEIDQGESIDLSWGSKNVASATLSEVGPVPAVGGITLTPTKTTTYVLTAQSVIGDTVTCNTTVTVN